MSELKEGANLIEFMASGINKNDPVFQAIFSNPEGEGAIANELEEVVKFIDYYTKTDDVVNHKGDTLDLIIQMFTKFDRYLGESDTAYLRRMQAITQRKGDKIWGNKWDIIHVFETYFPGRRIYLCENTSSLETNSIINGDFEEPGGWVLGSGAVIARDARFSKDRGLLFNGSGICTQSITVIHGGVYTLHFFLKGECNIQIQCNDGQYWNAKSLSWLASPTLNNYSREEWDNDFMFIRAGDNSVLTVTFKATAEKAAYIDYVRLFKKEKNPSYTIIVNHEGFPTIGKTLHLAAGGEDPSHDVLDYSNESYFDHSYIVGSKSSYTHNIYSEILDIIRPKGIKAYVEFAERATD
jgi:hypothetical protein